MLAVDTAALVDAGVDDMASGAVAGLGVLVVAVFVVVEVDAILE